MLTILKQHGYDDLPKDLRTLLKTLRHVETLSKCSGTYTYLGISNGIQRTLNNNPSFDGTEILLIVNVDGLPISKPSSLQLWPIMCRFYNFEPFVVTFFCGDRKPSSVDSFTNDFFNEFDQLKLSGVLWGDKMLTLTLKMFCCDAPALQFLKSVKGHTGYYGCEMCTVQGSLAGRVVFNDLDCSLRSDFGFNRELYESHQVDVVP